MKQRTEEELRIRLFVQAVMEYILEFFEEYGLSLNQLTSQGAVSHSSFYRALDDGSASVYFMLDVLIGLVLYLGKRRSFVLLNMLWKEFGDELVKAEEGKEPFWIEWAAFFANGKHRSSFSCC